MNTKHPSKTLGITLIEVIFSIGVILIGLLGLLSILPLAGHRAQDALDLDNGTAISSAAFHELEARDLLQEPKVTTLPTAPATIPGARIIPIAGGSIRNATDDIVPFCFDPTFAAASPTAATGPTNSYTPNVFPYFLNNHNPLQDPAKAASTNTTFPNQPRLTRVGLNMSGFSAARQLEIAKSLVESKNDLVQVRPKDRTLPSILGGLQAVTGGLPFGTSVASGKYSWMVTVDPNNASTHAAMSVVVYRSREGFSAFPSVTAAGTATSPRSNAISERVALVIGKSGFRGGAGGTIEIMSSADTLPDLTTSDWIMLSRNTGGDLPQNQVHRWYQVISTQKDSELISDLSSYSTHTFEGQAMDLDTLSGGESVWRTTARLSGSDWEFGMPPSMPGNWWTYATIVRDVVSVKTEQISLADF